MGYRNHSMSWSDGGHAALVSDGDASFHAIEDRSGSRIRPKQRQILLRFLLFDHLFVEASAYAVPH